MGASRRTHDIIVLGGGHNGLVAAAYLARSGRRVALVERRHVLGGAAVTEEIVPGFKFSRASYVYSLFRPQIVKDLDLASRGLTLLPRVPSSFTPTPERGGRSLTLGAGDAADVAAIAQHSTADAAAWPSYNAQLARFSAALTPLLDRPPPDLAALVDVNTPWRDRLANARDAAYAVRHLGSLGREIPDFLEFLTAPATRVLDRTFESDILKATLATDAIIGAFVPPSAPQTSYVLLHHVMCGAWANVRGGMGALSAAIARAAVEAGAELRTNSTVRRILVEGGGGHGGGTASRAVGVELADGTALRAPVVLSCAAPRVTFLDLLESQSESRGVLPDEFVRRIDGAGLSTGSVKINLALDRLPSFNCAPTPDGVAGPHHRGTIHFETDVATIEAAFADAAGGRPSQRPVIEMTLPSVLDDSIAPPGKHVCLLFVQYAPYKLGGGAQWDAASRAAFAARVYAVIESYAPGFTASIVGEDILTPDLLEATFGLPGGNIFHGEMGLDALWAFRPAPRWARHRTPVQGLYLGGAGAHPGGGVMGAAGRNAAAIVLADIAADPRLQ